MCDSPRCVGQTTDCLIQLGHADGYGDTIRITETFDRIDPDNANIRVPAVGNLPIVAVTGNTTCTIAGSLPCLIGPSGSTLSGLPGTAGDGVVTFQTDTYVIQPGDPSPLEDQANAGVQDLCDDPGTQGCSGVTNTIQFTAATEIGACCHSPQDVGFAFASELTLLLLAADDFVPIVSQINEVTWWGFYINYDSGPTDCGPGLGDDFQLKIYEDDGGLPGAPVATRMLSPVKTLDGVRFFNYDEYKYVASLGTPIELTNGQCYWIEITNNSPTTQCYWFWSPSGEGNSHVVHNTNNGVYEPWDNISASDLAFCFDVGIDPSDCGNIIGQCCPSTPGTCSEVAQANCATGRWRFDATCTPNPCATPANNACGSAIAITDGVTEYDNWWGTTDGPGGTICDSVSTTISADIWYAYTATCTGSLTASLCDQTVHINPVLAVYGDESPTCACPPTAPLIQCADDTCISNPIFTDTRPSVTIAATEGNCYLFRLGNNGNLTDQGYGQIAIECLGAPRYVDASATGANDGTSWADAFIHLQDALAVVVPGNEIWVAAGTYMPDGGYKPDGGAHVAGSGDRTATFQLLDGVAIYGGFAGTETLMSQRNIAANPTILSGDLAKNDGPSFANYGENSYHVVTADGVVSSTLDGFVVTAGFANGISANENGGGIIVLNGASPLIENCQIVGNGTFETEGSGGGADGAGAHITNSDPQFTNCVFHGNQAIFGGQGGGVICLGGDAQPVFTNCRFTDNSAVNGGGAVYIAAGASPYFNGCKFVGNTGGGAGGALCIDSGSATAESCLFAGNSSQTDGGAVWDAFGATFIACSFFGNTANNGGGIAAPVGGAGEARIVNSEFSGNTAVINGGALAAMNGITHLLQCTLSDNVAGVSGGGLYAFFSNPDAHVTSTVFWNNADAGGIDESAQLSKEGNGDFTLNYSLVAGLTGGLGGIGNIDANPLFVDPDGIDGVIGTIDDDLRLRAGSPAIDAGDSTALPLDEFDLDGDLNTTEYVPFDLAGNARQFDDLDTVDTGVPGSPVVDMGAYEFFTDCNGNGVEDSMDLAMSTSLDCDSSGWAANNIPDECDIVSCEGEPVCSDCNLNGVPDGCDIGAATSADLDENGSPDECVFFIAECDPPTDEWSCFNNWDLPGDIYPDNDMSAAYSVVLSGPADDVCLDVPVTIDTLDLTAGASLRITQPDPACGSGPLSARSAASGPALTFEVVAAGGLNVESSLSVAGSNEIDVTSGPMVVGPDGTYAADAAATQSVAAALSAAELRIEGNDCHVDPCPHGGRVELTDNMSLIVDGDMTIDGRLANGECDFDRRGGAEYVRSFHTPPIKIIRDSASVSIFGNVVLLGAAATLNESSVPISIGGDFDNQSTRPDCFDWSQGGMVLIGPTGQVFEVGSTDTGSGALRGGFPPFYINSVTISQNADVTLRDEFDNDGGGQGSCTEALYVGTLTLEAGATLTLDSCRVYAQILLKHPTAVINPTGCAAAAPPSLESDPSGVSTSRFFAVIVPNAGLVRGVPLPELTALRVQLTSLHHPPNAPPGTPNFTSHEGTHRYVNSFGGVTTCVDSNTFATNFRCGQLGCQPEYRDWATELAGATNPASPAGLIHVAGDAVVPSSMLNVSHIAASCGAAPAANICALASEPLAVVTSRWGDVGSGGAGPPDGNANVIDIGLVVDNVKGLATAIPERRAWLKNPTNPFANPVNVIDIGLTVDAVKGLPYPYSIAPCP